MVHCGYNFSDVRAVIAWVGPGQGDCQTAAAALMALLHSDERRQALLYALKEQMFSIRDADSVDRAEAQVERIIALLNGAGDAGRVLMTAKLRQRTPLDCTSRPPARWRPSTAIARLAVWALDRYGADVAHDDAAMDILATPAHLARMIAEARARDCPKRALQAVLEHLAGDERHDAVLRVVDAFPRLRQVRMFQLQEALIQDARLGEVLLPTVEFDYFLVQQLERAGDARAETALHTMLRRPRRTDYELSEVARYGWRAAQRGRQSLHAAVVAYIAHVHPEGAPVDLAAPLAAGALRLPVAEWAERVAPLRGPGVDEASFVRALCCARRAGPGVIWEGAGRALDVGAALALLRRAGAEPTADDAHSVILHMAHGTRSMADIAARCDGALPVLAPHLDDAALEAASRGTGRAFSVAYLLDAGADPNPAPGPDRDPDRARAPAVLDRYIVPAGFRDRDRPFAPPEHYAAYCATLHMLLQRTRDPWAGRVTAFDQLLRSKGAAEHVELVLAFLRTPGARPEHAAAAEHAVAANPAAAAQVRALVDGGLLGVPPGSGCKRASDRAPSGPRRKVARAL